MMRRVDKLELAGSVLADGGFTLESREIDGLGCVIIAETIYALAMIISAPLNGLEERVDDAQAALTRLAAIHPSPRSWDLYLVLVVDDDSQSHERIREIYESDTHYARKLVVGGDRKEVERSLSSLLPLREIPEIELADPLTAVRDQLLAAATDPDLVEAAISSFARTSEIEIP
jgi:hypothetical protein